MAFTPINARYGPPPSSQKRLQLAAPPVELSTADSSVLAAVSQYLGRGESSITAAVAAVAGATKKATRGKKRSASRSHFTLNSKVHRTGDIGDDMHINDQADQQTPEESVYTADSQQRPLSKMASGNCKLNTGQAVSIGSRDAESPLSVPLFFSFTTMDTLDSTSSRTSMDIVSASGGRGCTIYQSAANSLEIFSRDNAQTWLPVSESSSNSCEHHLDAENRGSSQVHLSSGTADWSAMPEPSKRLTKKAKQIAIKKTSSLFNSPGTQGHVALACTEPLQPPLATGPHEQDDLCASNPGLGNALSQSRHSSISEDDFGSDIDDDVLAEAALAMERRCERRPKTPPMRSSRQNTKKVDEFEDYGGLLLSESERETLSITSQIWETVSWLTQLAGKYSSSAVNGNLPIVRGSFPSAILDRSPIFGASGAVILRTCFRLGEALNAGCQAVRNNRSVVLELYARVDTSWREPQPGRKQFFQLKDLYHDKPPYLEGVFELHEQSDLWNLDSKVFLDRKAADTVCRAVARMKRTDRKWCLEILSIWEATLEDVQYAAGIYEKAD